MHGDARNEQVKVKIKYSYELSENIPPEPTKAGVVISPEEYAKVKKWHINRIFYFLIISSLMCLTTAALVPNPEVQVTALTIWAGSAAIAKRLLAGAYRKSGKAQRR